MAPALVLALALSVVTLWSAAIGFGIASQKREVSRQKGRFRLLSIVLVAAGILLMGLLLLLNRFGQPTLFAEGVIEQVRVHGGRSSTTDVRVRASSGFLVLHASGRSPYFRPGERISLVYQQYTGSILKARFRSPLGQEEGHFRNADWFYSILALCLGIYLLWSAIALYRRDPEGAIQTQRSDAAPLGSVDEASLLHLSCHDPDHPTAPAK